jgi:hypothetical protein
VDGEDLRTFITTFFGNIFMAIMGVAAIRFMVKREFVAFSSFTVVAVGVGVFLYCVAWARPIADTLGG